MGKGTPRGQPLPDVVNAARYWCVELLRPFATRDVVIAVRCLIGKAVGEV